MSEVSTPNNMARFQGIEDPPLDVEAPSWLDRLTALYYHHPYQWAKYGPYPSKKAAQRVTANIRKQLTPTERSYLCPQFQVASSYFEQEEYWYLYIKVGDTDGLS